MANRPNPVVPVNVLWLVFVAAVLVAFGLALVVLLGNPSNPIDVMAWAMICVVVAIVILAGVFRRV